MKKSISLAYVLEPAYRQLAGSQLFLAVPVAAPVHTHSVIVNPPPAKSVAAAALAPFCGVRVIDSPASALSPVATITPALLTESEPAYSVAVKSASHSSGSRSEERRVGKECKYHG